MKSILIDVKHKSVGIVEFENTLEDYYKLLGCRMIDIANRSIAGKRYDIICDDEGLLKDEPIVSAIDGRGNPMLVGNLLFCLHDNHGETVELSDADMVHIIRCIGKIPNGHYILTQCEY